MSSFRPALTPPTTNLGFRPARWAFRLAARALASDFARPLREATASHIGRPMALLRLTEMWFLPQLSDR